MRVFETYGPTASGAAGFHLGNAVLSFSCTCGANACSAPPPGYSSMHGPDCQMTPPNERHLWKRILELEATVQALEARVNTGG
jgi:hypothetical protein